MAFDHRGRLIIVTLTSATPQTLLTPWTTGGIVHPLWLQLLVSRASWCRQTILLSFREAVTQTSAAGIRRKVPVRSLEARTNSSPFDEPHLGSAAVPRVVLWTLPNSISPLLMPSGLRRAAVPHVSSSASDRSRGTLSKSATPLPFSK